MTKNDLLYRLLLNFTHDSGSNLQEYLADDILKVFEQKLGTRIMAEMITKHPNHGYFVRYLDDFIPRVLNEQHQKNIEKTEQEIIELLNNEIKKDTVA